MAVWIKGTESILKKTQKPINSKYKDCAALSLFPGHSLSSTHCSSSKKEKKKKSWVSTYFSGFGDTKMPATKANMKPKVQYKTLKL